MLNSFAVTAKLICIFVFAYADCCFSHVVAQMLQLCMMIDQQLEKCPAPDNSCTMSAHIVKNKFKSAQIGEGPI